MTRKAALTGVASIVVLGILWKLASLAVASSFILPGPIEVLRDGVTLASSPQFRDIMLATCARGLSAFSFSLVASLAFGFASGTSDTFASMLKPWMTVIKSTPVVSFILIALLWFGSSSVPVFVSILMTLPVMTEATASGARSSDPKLLEMARVYRMSDKDILTHIRLPSALPFLLSGAGSSLGLTWKVVVAGEILSSPKYGIGSSMQTAKVHLETARVFSLTLAAIALSVATELAFNALVRWSRGRALRVEA
jgi:NitT/TauT family transport system permease protein